MSTLLTDALPVKQSTVEEAQQFIDHSMKKTVESILATGYGFRVLSEACKREDKNFSEIVDERYQINKSNASRWVRIGLSYEVLLQHCDKLPASYSTIYSLTTLPKKAFNEVMDSGEIDATLTFEEAEKIKQAYKTEKEVKKEKSSTNPFEDDITLGEGAIPPDEMPELLVTSNKSEPIEGDFREVKQTRKRKLTLLEALKRLDIDIDDAYVLAKKKGEFTQDELIEALEVLGGEMSE